MLLGGLGLLQTIPLFATLGVERGWWPSMCEILRIFVTGGPLHFMFHIQTKANFMAQTIFVGGAKYRATGRGFVTQHTPMDEQFRFFASSHLYLGAEMGAGMLLMAIYTDAGQYFGRTWSLWLASISFLASPFWFNPLTFEWAVVTSDYDRYLRWMRGTTGDASKSWSVWWSEENSFYRTMPNSSKLFFSLKAIIYLIIAEGIRQSDLFKTDTSLYKPLVSVSHILVFIVILFLLGQIFTANERTFPYPIRRTIGIVITIGLVAGIVAVFIEDVNCIRYALAAYYGVGALCLIGLLTGVKYVKQFYLIHDLVMGHIIFVPLFIFGALQVPHYIQTWLLYHNALSSDVVVGDILRYARKNQEATSGQQSDEDLVEQLAELRKIVQKQEKTLNDVGLGMNEDAIANLTTVAPNSVSVSERVTITSEKAKPSESNTGDGVYSGGFGGMGTAKRVMSMSGLDVWGEISGVEPATEQLPSYQMVAPPVQPNSSGGFSFTQPDTMPPR